MTFGNRPTFGDEKLTNYELGAKIGFADGRAQFNISAYRAEIDDLQAVILAGSCSSRIVMNVPKAHSSGVEIELAAQPTERFDFGITATMMSSEVDSTSRRSSCVVTGSRWCRSSRWRRMPPTSGR